MCQLTAGQGLLYVDWLIMANIVPVWCIWSVHIVRYGFAFFALSHTGESHILKSNIYIFLDIWKEHQVF